MSERIGRCRQLGDLVCFNWVPPWQTAIPVCKPMPIRVQYQASKHFHYRLKLLFWAGPSFFPVACSLCLCLSFSLSVSVCLSVCLSVSLPAYTLVPLSSPSVCVCHSVYLLLILSVSLSYLSPRYLPTCMFVFLSSPSVHLSVSVCRCVSASLFLSPCPLCLPTCMFVSLSLSSVCLSLPCYLCLSVCPSLPPHTMRGIGSRLTSIIFQL